MDVPPRLVIAGIGTDVGKTFVSAVLCAGLRCDYWKPIQSGRLPMTDTEWVRQATGLPEAHFHPEAYLLDLPASPHLAAAAAGRRIDPSGLQPPATPNPLLIELAGGLMVPLDDQCLMIDVLAAWRLPVVLVVRTYLGSINHSLLSVEALRSRGIPLLGLVMNAGDSPAGEEAILKWTQAPLLGRLPSGLVLGPDNARAVFQQYFTWGGAALT